MKKNVLKVLVMFAIATSLFTACKKDEDTEAPVITLIGDDPFIISNIGDDYDEPGFSATDNEDGNITAKVTTTTDLDVDVAGTYEIHYGATDEAGNSADQHREVIVKNTADANKGSYNVVVVCTGLADYNYSETIGTSTTINNRLIFGKFGNYAGAENKVFADINGGSVTIPSQTYSVGSPTPVDRTFSGTGSISTAGGTTTISISVTEAIVGQTSVTCAYTWTK